MRSRMSDQYAFTLIAVVVVAVFLHVWLAAFVQSQYSATTRVIAIIAILLVGIGFVMRHVVDIIEATTEVLQQRTGLAGGLLQSFGTAFPDMIIGIVAALLSVRFQSTDYVRAVNLAIVAGAATFGSNIYNILYSVWCIFRQNLANRTSQTFALIPLFPRAGLVTPVIRHRQKPQAVEFSTAIHVLVALTMLTMAVAVSMVLFGRVPTPPDGFHGDLYQLVRPVGLAIFLLCLGVLFLFRKNQRPAITLEDVVQEERYYEQRPTARIWFDLALSAAAIYLTAEAMVAAIEAFAAMTHTPYVIAGALAGIIGCLSEMAVVHKFIVNPNGRIGDAIVGVAMDNILTTLGASVVALVGGIFLGGAALIVIFVVILTANTLLIAQIAELKDSVAHA